MNWNEFCQKISELLRVARQRLSLSYDDNKITYMIASQQYMYTKEEFDILKQNVDLYEFKCYSISNQNIYQSIVDLPDFISRRTFEDKWAELTVKDEGTKIEYSFQEISNELIWYVIKDWDMAKRVPIRFPYSFFERKCEALPEKDLFSLLKIVIRIPFALIVESNSSKSRDQLEKYAKSFLFNVAYNFDLVFKEVTDIDDIIPQRMTLSKRRNHDVTELMAPQLLYKQELVEQYYMALTSEDPFVNFIGFYHIMEYFYEDVYNEDILNSVQRIIQHPGFSAKRTKDVVKIVDIIKKKAKQGKEQFQGSELEALELTLKKFIDIGEIINDLNEFDPTIIDYYKTTEVGFSKGDAIDLRDIHNEKLFRKLAARIYKTRNALVHSKSNESRVNERSVYKPFDNSQDLLKEIPLMRFVSEAIIINSASPL